MSSTYKLFQIKEWSEKLKGFPEGTLRIYCGSLLCGMAYPTKDRVDEYSFEKSESFIFVSKRKNLPLQQIKDEVELSLKEFLKKIIS